MFSIHSRSIKSTLRRPRLIPLRSRTYTGAMKYITGEKLAAMMKSDAISHKDFIVVDVRDDDYVGGNIKNSFHLPSREFLGSAHELLKRAEDVPLVIFHCTFSEVRGPKAARIYEETRQNLASQESSANVQDVIVLQGGFAQFQAKFKDDPALVENWDKAVWETDWS